MNEVRKVLKFILAGLFVLTTAALSITLTDVDTTWYQGLNKPVFLPPDVVFPIVWGILFLLFALSFAFVLSSPQLTPQAFLGYLLLGILNPFFCFLFFQQHQLVGSLFLVGLMFIIGVMLFERSYRINRLAAYLLLPNLLWLGFALFLCYEMAFIN